MSAESSKSTDQQKTSTEHISESARKKEAVIPHLVDENPDLAEKNVDCTYEVAVTTSNTTSSDKSKSYFPNLGPSPPSGRYDTHSAFLHQDVDGPRAIVGQNYSYQASSQLHLNSQVAPTPVGNMGTGIQNSNLLTAYNPHHIDNTKETTQTSGTSYIANANSSYVSPGAYGYGMTNYTENLQGSDTSRPISWSDPGLQHLYQPPHVMQNPSLHYPSHSHGAGNFVNQNSHLFDDGTTENQDMHTGYHQGPTSLSNTDLSGAMTHLWPFHHGAHLEYSPHHIHAMQSGVMHNHPPLVGGISPLQHKSMNPQVAPYPIPGPPLQSSESNKGPDGANLFIFHIPNDFTNLDMCRLFAPYGNLVSVRIMVEKDTGRSRGFGFVSYDNPDSAARAIKELNGVSIANKRLKVQHKQIKSYEHRHAAPSKGASIAQHQEGSVHLASTEPTYNMNDPGFDSFRGNAGTLWTTEAMRKPYAAANASAFSQVVESSTSKKSNSTSADIAQGQGRERGKGAPLASEAPSKQDSYKVKNNHAPQVRKSFSGSNSRYPRNQTSGNNEEVTGSSLNEMESLRNALPDPSPK